MTEETSGGENMVTKEASISATCYDCLKETSGAHTATKTSMLFVGMPLKAVEMRKCKVVSLIFCAHLASMQCW